MKNLKILTDYLEDCELDFEIKLIKEDDKAVVMLNGIDDTNRCLNTTPISIESKMTRYILVADMFVEVKELNLFTDTNQCEIILPLESTFPLDLEIVHSIKPKLRANLIRNVTILNLLSRIIKEREHEIIGYPSLSVDIDRLLNNDAVKELVNNNKEVWKCNTKSYTPPVNSNYFYKYNKLSTTSVLLGSDTYGEICVKYLNIDTNELYSTYVMTNLLPSIAEDIISLTPLIGASNISCMK